MKLPRKIIRLLTANKTSPQTILKNTSWLLVSEFFAKLAGILITISIARKMGTSYLGTFNFTLSSSWLLLSLTNLQINPYITQQIAKNKTRFKQIFNQHIILKLILTAIASLTSIVIFYLLNLSLNTNILFLLFTATFTIGHINEFLTTIFQAFEKLHTISFLRIIEALIISSGVLFLHLLEPTLITIAVFYLIASIVSLQIYLKLIKFKIQPTTPTKTWKTTIQLSFPFSILNTFHTVQNKISLVFLGIITNPNLTGLFSVAILPILSMDLISGFINTSLFPHFSSKPTTKDQFLKLILAIILVATTTTTISFIIISPFLNFFFRDQFKGSHPITNILIPIIFFRFFSKLFGTYLSANNLQKKLSYYMTLPILLSVIINYYLITRYGLLGAAYAFTISEATTSATTLLAFLKHSKLDK